MLLYYDPFNFYANFIVSDTAFVIVDFSADVKSESHLK